MNLKFLRVRQTGLGLALALVVAAVSASCGNASVARSASTSGAAFQVTSRAVGPAVPSGFLGLSAEYKSLSVYTGNSTVVDQPFAHLVTNLNPGGHPILRIGGDSTDWAWWPVPGMAKPGGIRFTLTARYLAAAKALITDLGGRYIFGIQFEADSRRIAGTEASQIVRHVGRSNIDALELGNEPELYHAFAWYKTPAGQRVYGRSNSYTPQAYNRDWRSIASAITSAPVAGPSSGGPEWLNELGTFVRSEPRLHLVTIHAYPTKKCGKTNVQASDFFQNYSLQGLANLIGSKVRTARTRHLPLRVDEMNSISCGGQGNLSPAFAPALWAVDFLPRVVRAGATGVNFHTTPGSWQALINAHHTSAGWKVSVEPEYYGLMMFAQAAPAGARMLHIGGTGVRGIDAWAARTRDGHINVILINKTRSGHTVKLGVDGSKGAAGTVTRLRASGGLYAKRGTNLGGQRVGETTGQLTGRSNATQVTPTGGVYPVYVPGYSATELSF